MSTFTTRTFTNVFTDARAVGLLNDAAQDRYTDAVLLPHGAFAYIEIQEDFADAGIPLIETVTDTFAYTANAASISIPGGITDLAEPLELWEKGDTETADNWLPMKRVAQVGPTPATSLDRLYEWEWSNGAIRVNPCSSARDVFVRYRRQLAYPAAGDPIGFDRIYLALVAGTAFFAATARPDVQQKAGVMYVEAKKRAIRIASRDRQVITYRRRPWNYQKPRTFRQEST